MDPKVLMKTKELVIFAVQKISSAFEKIAAWVTRLSWWKFFLFSMITMISGGILQDNLFTPELSTSKTKNLSKNNPHTPVLTGEESNIEIAHDGIHIKKKNVENQGKEFVIDSTGVHEISEKNKEITDKSEKIASNSTSSNDSDIFIKLPPEIAQRIQDGLSEELADAANMNEVEIVEIQKRSSKWFMNFIVLLIFGLFGMKALMGGKVRAEENAKVAQESAEKESLKRQVSEAQVQMMQAQVEPHFLFNTLASVEFLIETDPPRAAKMQRSLISYLRAVLPQIRNNETKTNLGREADIIKSYLALLKMRMEERLSIDFNMPDGLRSAAFPPMMLQSLVENAIKHGLEVKEDGGTLSFSAEIVDNKLRVKVSDDGLGFGAVPSNGTGLGLQNIKERLKLLYKNNAQLIITPNQPTGVCITIEIPYELAK